jgi:prepilin-type N-terminal cleavage/methylation domain-containing protein
MVLFGMSFAHSNLNDSLNRRHKLNSLRETNGFTLIEILVAIVILSISLLAMAGLMATTTRNTSFGGHLTEAATFAQDRLEEFRVTPWASIGNGSDTTQGLSSGITYTRTWTVAVNGDLKTVTLRVSWSDQAPRSFNVISAFAL